MTTFGPANPLYPILIVWLHDTMSLSFRWIGRLFGVSQVNIFRLYRRWYGFAHGHGHGPIVWPEAKP